MIYVGRLKQIFISLDAGLGFESEDFIPAYQHVAIYVILFFLSGVRIHPRHLLMGQITSSI
jgi:hypothetical protein